MSPVRRRRLDLGEATSDGPIAALRAGVPHTARTVDDLDAAHAPRRGPSSDLSWAGLDRGSYSAAESGRDDPQRSELAAACLGHEGACAAAALTVPTARMFLDRWFRGDLAGSVLRARRRFDPFDP